MNTDQQLQICIFDPGHPHRCQHITTRALSAEHADGSGPIALPAGTRVMMMGFAVDLEDPEKGCMVAQVNEAIILLPEDATCPIFLLYLR